MATLSSVLCGGHSQPQDTSVGVARLLERTGVHISLCDFEEYSLLIVMQGNYFSKEYFLRDSGLPKCS